MGQYDPAVHRVGALRSCDPQKKPMGHGIGADELTTQKAPDKQGMGAVRLAVGQYDPAVHAVGELRPCDPQKKTNGAWHWCR